MNVQGFEQDAAREAQHCSDLILAATDDAGASRAKNLARVMNC
jgi:hypothetical protein